MADDDVALNVKLPRELHARMKARAAMAGESIRGYVTTAVAERVERDEADAERRAARRRR